MRTAEARQRPVLVHFSAQWTVDTSMAVTGTIELDHDNLYVRMQEVDRRGDCLQWWWW
jgi:hypothetical protein